MGSPSSKLLIPQMNITGLWIASQWGKITWADYYHPLTHTGDAPLPRVKSPPSSLKLNERNMDEKISNLFEEWLSAFDAVQFASGEEAIRSAQNNLSEIETQLANTSGEGMECLAIKLGLHYLLNEHTDAASLLSESAYRDLVRLTGRDPAAEISGHFRQ